MNDPFDNIDFEQECLLNEFEEMHNDSNYNGSVYYSPKVDTDFNC